TQGSIRVVPGERGTACPGAPGRASHERPACPPRPRDHRRGDAVTSFRRLRSGRQPHARAAGCACADPRGARGVDLACPGRYQVRWRELPVPEIPVGVRDVLLRLDMSAVVDILIVSGSIYWLLLLVRGTTAMTVLRGVGVLLVGAFIVSRIFDLTMLNWMLRNSLAGLVIGLVVIFQPEIRRALERLGRTGIRYGRRAERQDVINVLVRSAAQLARQSVGALIVLERDTGLQEVIDTGVPLDAQLSTELLSS